MIASYTADCCRCAAVDTRSRIVIPYALMNVSPYLNVLIAVTLLSYCIDLVASTSTVAALASDRVDLRSIQTITFSESLRAITRNGTSKPQLICKGGSASGVGWFSDYNPSLVQCTNVGFDGANVQWSCDGNLAATLAFGNDSIVICDPYIIGVNDGFVVRGSCRFEYTLNFNPFRITYFHVIYGALLHATTIVQPFSRAYAN